MLARDGLQVLEKLVSWHDQGRKLPGYKRGNGYPYLYKLLNIDYSLHRAQFDEIERAYPDIHQTLLGPHGWTFLQVLIIRYQDREKANEQRNTRLQKSQRT